MDDERTLSDALADAILRMGYPDLHRGDGVCRTPPKKKKVHKNTPQPEGLTLPRGLTWNYQLGRVVARFCVGKKHIYVGSCAPEDIPALVEKREQAIRAALGRKEAA